MVAIQRHLVLATIIDVVSTIQKDVLGMFYDCMLNSFACRYLRTWLMVACGGSHGLNHDNGECGPMLG